MNRREDNKEGPARESRADLLRFWADELDRVADRYTERLDYEGYTGLSEHACELRAAAALLACRNRDAHVAKLIELARDHLRFIEEAYEEEASP
jgi:hypothetical protein